MAHELPGVLAVNFQVARALAVVGLAVVSAQLLLSASDSVFLSLVEKLLVEGSRIHLLVLPLAVRGRVEKSSPDPGSATGIASPFADGSELFSIY